MILIYILITFVILSVLILTHEFGHFLAARLTGVRVLEFSLGMGPALFQKQTENTLYSVRALPIGGYCSLQEETKKQEEVELLDGMTTLESEDESLDPNESFINKPAWVRFTVLIAGVLMNFILAFIIIFIASLISGRGFLESFSVTAKTFVEMFGLVFLSIKMLFTGEASVNDLTGPVGIVKIVGDFYSYGLIFFLLFTAMISINLGIFNLLPIPALDGGQILFLVLEKLKGNAVSERLKGGLILTSYVLLLGLAAYVMFQDVLRFLQ